jgi:DNA-binding transcriptional ArsR family regulator
MPQQRADNPDGSKEPAGSAGAVFAALADPTRRSILALISAAGGEATSTTLAASLGISRQAVAKQVAILTHAELVVSTRAGRETRLTVRTQAFGAMVDWLMDLAGTQWDDRLGRLRQLLMGHGSGSPGRG